MVLIKYSFEPSQTLWNFWWSISRALARRATTSCLLRWLLLAAGRISFLNFITSGREPTACGIKCSLGIDRKYFGPLFTSISKSVRLKLKFPPSLDPTCLDSALVLVAPCKGRLIGPVQRIGCDFACPACLESELLCVSGVTSIVGVWLVLLVPNWVYKAMKSTRWKKKTAPPGILRLKTVCVQYHASVCVLERPAVKR